MLQDLINNGIPAWVLLVLAGGLALYGAAAVWTHLSVGRLMLQNLFRSNQVELPRLGRPQPVPSAGTSESESTALVLSRAAIPINPNQPATRDFTNIIYPVAGRNGLHFTPDRCTGCGLCTYTCPTEAVTTHEQDNGYLRRFDLKACVYCGLCESACPTSAIRLTLNSEPTQKQEAQLMVQGLVEAQSCRLCNRKAPQIDLLAERIYEMQGYDAEDSEPDEEEHLRRLIAVKSGPVCLECQKRVLEAEEAICG